MSGRRISERQITFAWTDPSALLEISHGDVLFEAPEVSRIVSGKVPRVPKVRQRLIAQEPPSLGLPFGVRQVAGRTACWSCGEEFADGDVVRVGPGQATCPGCGARLPFAD